MIGSAYETILTEFGEDGLLLITLNRPDRLNALTVQMGNELIGAFRAASEDDDVRAIIVTGAGRAFCAGMELKPEGAGRQNVFGLDPADVAGEDPEKLRDLGGRLALTIYDCKKPVIAAINGAAVGVGITMTLPMDFRIASTEARCGFVFTRLGIVPEACSSWFLPRLVGISQALEWVYSGRVFDSHEAKRGGLVRSLHEPDDLLTAARELAVQCTASSSPVAMALARQMIWKMAGADHPMEAHRVDSRAMFHTSMNEGKEGIAAFLEKRPAEFSARPSTEMPPFYPWWTERGFS